MPPGARCVPGPKEAHAWCTSESTCIASARTSPWSTSAAARVKTDAVDARTLAQLLRADLLPEAYIAPRELRDLRDLLRQRFVLTQMRTALKNRVHALIARQGVQHGHSKLLGPGGRAFLAKLDLRPEP